MTVLQNYNTEAIDVSFIFESKVVVLNEALLILKAQSMVKNISSISYTDLSGVAL